MRRMTRGRGSSGRPRSERREQARARLKLGRDREKLARLEAGGAPERPAVVESASQIEPHALAQSCFFCIDGGGAGSLRLDEHAALEHDGERLRIVRMHCAQCGARREMWFRIARPLPS
jgi:hypothetical protein